MRPVGCSPHVLFYGFHFMIPHTLCLGPSGQIQMSSSVFLDSDFDWSLSDGVDRVGQFSGSELFHGW